MIRRWWCRVRHGHAYCRYRPWAALWSCRCGLREQTDQEWIQEIFGS